MLESRAPAASQVGATLRRRRVSLDSDPDQEPSDQARIGRIDSAWDAVLVEASSKILRFHLA